MGWSSESAEVVTLVGRDPHLLLRELAPGRRVLVLSSDEHTPATVAGLLVAQGYAASRLTVLGDLGGPEESRLAGTAGGWSAKAPRLHVLALELAGPVVGSWSPGLPDAAYEHDGQLTKRDLRASALARLAPQPGQLLWDVGAGSGSVAVEAARLAPGLRVVAVERDAEACEQIRRNARGAAVRVVEGAAPAALADLPDPDRVFVGGGGIDVLDAVLARVRSGATVVATYAVLDAAVAAADRLGSLVQLQLSRGVPIGPEGRLRLAAENPVFVVWGNP
jgi:precorrin-6Y C5,15-methyltransferase (decarboxylating)